MSHSIEGYVDCVSHWQSFLFLGQLSNPTVVEVLQHSDSDVDEELNCIDKKW